MDNEKVGLQGGRTCNQRMTYCAVLASDAASIRSRMALLILSSVMGGSFKPLSSWEARHKQMQWQQGYQSFYHRQASHRGF